MCLIILPNYKGNKKGLLIATFICLTLDTIILLSI